MLTGALTLAAETEEGQLVQGHTPSPTFTPPRFRPRDEITHSHRTRGRNK